MSLRNFYLHQWRWIPLGLVLAAFGCKTPQTDEGPAVPRMMTLAAADGAYVIQGVLVSKKLRGAGIPRFYVACKRSALAGMPGDTVLMNGGGIAQTTQVLKDAAGPLWRGQEQPDAAMLPVRLPLDDNGKPVALESLADGAPGLPAPTADLMRLADQVPLR